MNEQDIELGQVSRAAGITPIQGLTNETNDDLDHVFGDVVKHPDSTEDK